MFDPNSQEAQDFLSAFGIQTDPLPTDPPPADPDPAPAVPDLGSAGALVDENGAPINLDDPLGVNENPELPADPDPAPAQPPTPDRANQAFAALRVENTSLKTTIKDVAKVLGVPENADLQIMLEQVKEKTLEANAKQTNVPIDILRDMERLKGLESQFTQSQRQQQTVVGFQSLVTKYGLSNEDVMAFAQELINDNKNPYETDVDILQEYRNRNFDKLVLNAREQGIREEQLRAAKAGTSSTVPNPLQGQVPGAPDKITTIDDLNTLLATYPK